MEEYMIKKNKQKQNMQLNDINQLEDIEEKQKINGILQNLLENKIPKLICKELKKNKIKRNMEIQINLDADF